MSVERKGGDVVLVVDDSPETLRMLTDALDAAGMTVVVALDGDAALRIVDNITPDVILLDAMLPGVDGFETCRRLKRLPAVSAAPVIFMTGLTETEHMVLGLRVGGVDYVTKPIVIEQMLARIRVHLTNARLTRSAKAALDVSHRHLFAVDATGAIVWATPQAQKLLAVIGATLALPPWRDWFNLVIRTGAEPHPPLDLGQFELRLHYLGGLGPNEFLLRLARGPQLCTSSEFSRELGLTPREGEVLFWLSRGKTNRDIAQILGLSPRTIDKHLEQIYVKLGVENRSSATAIAVSILRDNDEE